MTLKAKEFRDLSATEISERVKTRDLSASEVVEAALERMDTFEPHIHAFCTKGHDLARATAAALDERIAKGETPGPLAGVPIGIKDLVATKDLIIINFLRNFNRCGYRFIHYIGGQMVSK